MTASIQTNLLKWLIVPLLLINLTGACLTFWQAWGPTKRAWDHSLADAAWALVPRLKASNAGVQVDLPHQAEQVLRVDHFDSIFFVIRDAHGVTLAGDHDFPVLPRLEEVEWPHAEDGQMRHEPVRIITLKTQVGNDTVYIGAAETLRKRVRSRTSIIVALLMIEAVLAGLSIVVVWIAVRNGLHPLGVMQAALNGRREVDLSPVTGLGAPVELMPLLDAVNALLLRAQSGAAAQQNFLANVAHQLRTPLAGVKIHLEWLHARHGADNETATTMAMITTATDRMIRQSNQLLALARAEPVLFTDRSFAPLALDEIVAEAVQQFVQQADLRKIDLGFELHRCLILGDRFLLRDLVDNLIDNAIRYTPPAGIVTVRCVEDGKDCTLRVEDTGPGIAATHREAVFSRFYRIDDRIAGSGLGLAIVRDIAADHAARLTITSGPGGNGTHFIVTFKAAPADINRR